MSFDTRYCIPYSVHPSVNLSVYLLPIHPQFPADTGSFSPSLSRASSENHYFRSFSARKPRDRNRFFMLQSITYRTDGLKNCTEIFWFQWEETETRTRSKKENKKKKLFGMCTNRHIYVLVISKCQLVVVVYCRGCHVLYILSLSLAFTRASPSRSSLVHVIV